MGLCMQNVGCFPVPDILSSLIGLLMAGPSVASCVNSCAGDFHARGASKFTSFVLIRWVRAYISSVFFPSLVLIRWVRAYINSVFFPSLVLIRWVRAYINSVFFPSLVLIRWVRAYISSSFLALC